jgi:cobaltochelatase CobN
MHYLGQLPDLPLPHSSGPRLRTRRKPLAQIVLCQGCCCGQTERGLPAVPLGWLKPLWKAEKLNKVVQLTVSGCLGPCDLPNVCCIQTPQEQAWYGRLTTQEDYAVLVSWTRRCRDEGDLQPFPAELEHLRFERWPGKDNGSPFTPIAQDPADIVLLTAADTEVLTWSAAAAGLPEVFPSVRALNIDRLRAEPVFDAYLDDVLQESRVLVVRVLGGLGYWREHLEQIRLLALSHDLALVCLPGDAVPDAELAALCTVPLAVADTIFRYCIEGGVGNAAAMLRFVSDTLLGTAFGYEPPRPLPEVGVYHPDGAGVLTSAAWRSRFWKPERRTVGIAFYRAHWITGNLAPVDALVRALEARDLNVMAVFGPNLAEICRSGTLGDTLDVLIATTSFRMGSRQSQSPGRGEASSSEQADVLGRLDVPILQAISCASSENVWAANIAGLSPRDIAMNVALPEFDGRIITTAVSFKNTQAYDAGLQYEVIRYQPRADRVDYVAELARHWVRLRQTPNANKKVAILLANYPSKNSRVGNAVGLDTPASLHVLLTALRAAGYDTGPSFPVDGQALIEALIARSIQDLEFAPAAALERSAGWVTEEQYRTWLEACPAPSRQGILERWGEPGKSPQFVSALNTQYPVPSIQHPVPSTEYSVLSTQYRAASAHNPPHTTPDVSGFPIPGLALGNVFIGIQPARGYDQDPSAVYHSPDLAPPPYYLAFYRWIKDVFKADAVIHLGKHGNLEWLPGKGSALSAACYPEVVLQTLPNIYPYIINNPGEGAQAKRRSAAVIVDHLIPPMTCADTYGELRQLEHLLDEYYAVQSLDPGKAPLLLERIGQLLQDANLYRDLEMDQIPDSKQLASLLNRVDGYLCEIKESQIRDGLHVLGRLPEGEQLIDLLLSLVRVDNGSIPGIIKALAVDLGLDFSSLTCDPAGPVPPQILNSQFSVFNFQFPPVPCRTCGDVLEGLGCLARCLIQRCWECESPDQALASLSGRDFPAARQTLHFLWDTICPRLQQCPTEIEHIVTALAGRFVPPGPSGAPTRGTADILPTGRNFYSLDVRAIPTQTAWRVGCAAADALLQRHRERTGAYPESVALVVWGTSNMRTQGDDIAEVFYLLGVRPCWDEANRRVTGVEVIPLIELGRPRVDVTVRISGLFRDAFPNLVQLLNEAVALVARLEEPLDRNFIRAHIARDTALLTSKSAAHAPDSSHPTIAEALRIAGLRVFGSKPGAYGAGLLPLIDGRNWQTTEDLTRVYLTWSSYAYTGRAEDDGREEPEAFRLRLTQTQVVAQNQDNREHDIFDSDDYFQFHGGLIAAVRSLTGTAPDAYLGDTSQPDAVRARTLREEAYRVFRSRVVNPRWLAGVMRHGYKGAVEMAATVDYLFGYDATAEILDDWMYERLAAVYLFDDSVRDFLRRANPWAERAMIERLLEAAQRGLWEQPDPATLARLTAQHDGNEVWLESAGIS